MNRNYIQSCFQEFLDLLPTPGTRKQYRYDILEFYKGTLPENANDLQKCTTTEKIREWVRELRKSKSRQGKGLKPVTINRKLVALQRFSLYMQGKNLLTENPANPFSVPRSDCNNWEPKGLLSNADIQKLLESIKKKEPKKVISLRDQLFIQLGYCLLLKRSEIVNLSIENILKIEDKYVLKIFNSLGHDEVVPFSKEVKELFDGYWEALNGDKVVIPDDSGRVPILVSLSNRTRYERISDNFLNRLLKRRAIEANLSSSIHTETLRHSGINFLLQNGTPIADVAKLARIKDAKVLRVFPSPHFVSLIQSSKILSESIKDNDSNPL